MLQLITHLNMQQLSSSMNSLCTISLHSLVSSVIKAIYDPFWRNQHGGINMYFHNRLNQKKKSKTNTLNLLFTNQLQFTSPPADSKRCRKLCQVKQKQKTVCISSSIRFSMCINSKNRRMPFKQK